jgi:hypothetical protein
MSTLPRTHAAAAATHTPQQGTPRMLCPAVAPTARAAVTVAHRARGAAVKSGGDLRGTLYRAFDRGLIV